MQAKLEATAAGRALVSVILIVTLAAMLVANMPDSVIKTYLLGVAQPYLSATGLTQDWGVFAPDPAREDVYVTGRIDHSDGTSSVWPIQTRPGLMAYSDYRWQKFQDNVSEDDNNQLWRPFAEYLAHHDSAAGHTPVRVSLVRRWSDTLPPGPGAERGPWQEYVYYVLPLGGAK